MAVILGVECLTVTVMLIILFACLMSVHCVNAMIIIFITTFCLYIMENTSINNSIILLLSIFDVSMNCKCSYFWGRVNQALILLTTLCSIILMINVFAELYIIPVNKLIHMLSYSYNNYGRNERGVVFSRIDNFSEWRGRGQHKEYNK